MKSRDDYPNRKTWRAATAGRSRSKPLRLIKPSAHLKLLKGYVKMQEFFSIPLKDFEPEKDHFRIGNAERAKRSQPNYLKRSVEAVRRGIIS